MNTELNRNSVNIPINSTASQVHDLLVDFLKSRDPNDILRRSYLNGVLWRNFDLGEVDNATTLIVSSFAVCMDLGQNIIEKNANKDGWVAGCSFAMWMNMVLVLHLWSQGHHVVCIGLLPGAHMADAFDQNMPIKLANAMATSAGEIVKWVQGKHVYGLGKPVNKALKVAVDTFDSSLLITQL